METTKTKPESNVNIAPIISIDKKNINVSSTRKSLRPIRSLLPQKSFKPAQIVVKDVLPKIK